MNGIKSFGSANMSMRLLFRLLNFEISLRHESCCITKSNYIRLPGTNIFLFRLPRAIELSRRCAVRAHEPTSPKNHLIVAVKIVIFILMNLITHFKLLPI